MDFRHFWGFAIKKVMISRGDFRGFENRDEKFDGGID
jgi:hypothetical protein